MASDPDIGGGLYARPVLYDVVNTPGTAAEVTALQRVARRFGPRRDGGGRWLEPACGTGRYLRVLRGRGCEVAGYDPLPGMVEYARRRLAARWSRGWRLACASFTAPAGDLATLGPADVAFCPVNSLRHLADDQSVLEHLAQIAQLLDSDGVSIVGLDLHDPANPPDEDVWEARRGSLGVKQVVQYLPPTGGSRREQVVVATVESRPGGERHHHGTYDLRTYTQAQWDRLVSRSALRWLATCDANGRPVDRTARLPYQLEVLARR